MALEYIAFAKEDRAESSEVPKFQRELIRMRRVPTDEGG
jgi:hypothetical protein